MLFQFLAAVALVATLIFWIWSKATEDEEERKFARGWTKICGVLFILFVLLACVRIVPPGHVGVAITLGYVHEHPLNPGVNFVSPLTGIQLMDIRTQEYTMSKTELEGVKKGDDAIEVLSSDGLSLKLDVTVWFRILGTEAPKIYRTIGVDYVDKIVRPAIRTAFRDGAVRISGVEIYSEKREEYVQVVSKLIEAQVQDRGILLEKVLLRRVELPDSVKEAIEHKLQAEQDAQRMVFVLQKEKLEAERKEVEAKGIAAAQRIVAKDLTQQYLTWLWMTKIEAFGTGPNNAILILPYDQKLIPLLQVPGGGAPAGRVPARETTKQHEIQ